MQSLSKALFNNSAKARMYYQAYVYATLKKIFRKYLQEKKLDLNSLEFEVYSRSEGEYFLVRLNLSSSILAIVLKTQQLVLQEFLSIELQKAKILQNKKLKLQISTY